MAYMPVKSWCSGQSVAYSLLTIHFCSSAIMKPYNLLQALLFSVRVVVDAEAIQKSVAGSSRTGRRSSGNTRKFIVEVEPVT
jgi:hypothetical protein